MRKRESIVASKGATRIRVNLLQEVVIVLINPRKMSSGKYRRFQGVP